MSTTERERGRAETRETILSAAHQVIRRRGLANATTREIAREAGCAEGTLYLHFEDKEDLFLSVIRERLPDFLGALRDLRGAAGRRTVRGNLERLVRSALPFYGEIGPMTMGILANPALLERHRRAQRERNVGPHRAYDVVADYVREEQRLGRVSRGASPTGTAALLLGACYQYASLRNLLGEDALPLDDARLSREVVRTLMHGLDPREQRDPGEQRKEHT